MLKNALLSIKKSFGRTLLLFLLMFVIANLVISGLSIKSATSKSMEQVRKSLGSDVTLSYNMKNIMNNRENGASIDSVMESITIEMADLLKELDYVESYNYTISVNVSSDDLTPVSMQENNDQKNDFGGGNMELPKFMDNNDFSVNGNISMDHLTEFTNQNYTLVSGRLLSEEDEDTTNCVIESNLASDNELEVGDVFTLVSSQDDEDISVELTIVGIYEVETSDIIGNAMNMSNRQNPMNTIYTSLKIGQKLNGSEENITSTTYYLDDPDHIEEFKKQAKEKTDIDFDMYTLDANDSIYQKSISSLENMESFANLFLIVVVLSGCIILCLILVLTMRSRFYEFGVMLSLGQSKLKIMLQQFIEVIFIAFIAFSLSLGSSKMVSNVISQMLIVDNQEEVMKDDQQEMMKDEKEDKMDIGKDFFDKAMTSPVSKELDVSLTTDTLLKLTEIGCCISALSVFIPSLYILRLSPREILMKKEG